MIGHTHVAYHSHHIVSTVTLPEKTTATTLQAHTRQNEIIKEDWKVVNFKKRLKNNKIKAAQQVNDEGPSTKSPSKPRGKGMDHLSSPEDITAKLVNTDIGKLLDHQTYKYVVSTKNKSTPNTPASQRSHSSITDARNANNASSSDPSTTNSPGITTIISNLPQLHGHRPIVLPLADARDNYGRSPNTEPAESDWTTGEPSSPIRKQRSLILLGTSQYHLNSPKTSEYLYSGNKESPRDNARNKNQNNCVKGYKSNGV
ncbi:hypothetical protein P3S68_015907 [Capsicum galapagoense]